jgi:hypothetical protein
MIWCTLAARPGSPNIPPTGSTNYCRGTGTALGAAKSGSLIVAAIASVFAIGYAANLLGEDEDWLHELSIDMFPEHGRLWVYGVGEDVVTAFPKTASRVCVRSSSTNEPAAVRRHRSNPPNSPASAVLTAWKLAIRPYSRTSPPQPSATATAIPSSRPCEHQVRHTTYDHTIIRSATCNSPKTRLLCMRLGRPIRQSGATLATCILRRVAPA